MTASSLALLGVMVVLGTGLIGLVLGVRATDQHRRDRRRTVVMVRLPRGLKPEQIQALVRTIIGLAPARSGLVGRDTVALEMTGTRTEIIHRLRLPASASTYLIGQLRATVPGLAVEEVNDVTPETWQAGVELRRRLTAADLVVTDVAAISRTILAALTNLGRGERLTWQLVVGGGIAARPPAHVSVWHRLVTGGSSERGAQPQGALIRHDGGMVAVAVRLGAAAGTQRRAAELVARLQRAAGSVSAPHARLVPRRLPQRLVTRRITWAATPITATSVFLRPEELTALLGWPVGSPLIPGLTLGGSPQLPASAAVPTHGRRLGRSTASDRPVAGPVTGAREHTLITGPTGSGKSWLAARLFLGDVATGRGGLLLDPKGGLARAVLERLPEAALGRTVVIDPTDTERPVPLPLLASERGGIPELAADTLVGLLRHRYRDLGPRSSDILSASLYALARVPDATLMDLLPLWGDGRFRARVAGLVQDDPVLASFFAWFEALGAAERSYILAAPLNKIRPLLQRPVVRNVLAAPRATFTIAQALRERLVVIVLLPEGVLGGEATSLLGQVVLARLWSAVQARTGRAYYNVTVDEAPRFLDQPTDLGDVLARSREYGVGLTLITQSLGQLPLGLRDVALNSARTKLAFGTSAADARRLADEFGPSVEADFFTGLARYEAIGAVSLGGTVSPPFTFATEALGPPVPGRAQAIRAASRQRFGLPRTDIEAALNRATDTGSGPTGPVGRRTT